VGSCCGRAARVWRVGGGGAAVAFVLVELKATGGSSGPGTGIPPAGGAPRGPATASAHPPATSASRTSRRDDVRMGTTSLPFEASPYVGRRPCVNTPGGGPPAFRCPPSPASALALLLRHPSLDRVTRRTATLAAPRALAHDLELVGAMPRLRLRQGLARLGQVESHGERRHVVRLLDRAAAARAIHPDRGVLVRRAELERERPGPGVLPAPRAPPRPPQGGAAG